MKHINTDHTFVICAYGESPFLEECVRSLVNQSVPSAILIATSTPSPYIEKIAEKYQIPVFVRDGKSGITQDWNYAYAQAKTSYVTIAHQDDVYLEDYTACVIREIRNAKKPLIAFTDYGEIRNGEVVLNNRLLKFKRLLLFPFRMPWTWKSRWIRRRSLSFGSAICCPSVTFVRERLPKVIFSNRFKAACDWEAWEKISKLEGEFVFCNKVLMYHRIHEGSETTKQLDAHNRRQEEIQMFRKFWPGFIALFLEHWYVRAEKSNQLS